jgi:hypothetical protein
VSELTLLIFRIAFLIALWVFVFFVVYAVRSDLFGEKVKRLIPSKAAPVSSAQSVFLTSAQTPLATPRPPVATTPAAAAGPLTLVITAGAKQGESITLTTKPVSIGRSSDSSIVIRDDYTSTHHARLEYRSGKWIINDLGSTNGTFLAGTKVTEPTEVPLNTPITIGATTFEIRA